MSSRYGTGLVSTGTGAEEKVVPADLLLLAGTCIVEEAVLTGESTPQWKLPITKPADKPSNGKKTSTLSPEEILNITRDKQHVLFSGTKVLQHTADKNAHLKTPDGGCLAVVLRTGFGTSQGTCKIRPADLFDQKYRLIALLIL